MSYRWPLILFFPLICFAEILFQSNFESNRIYSAIPLKPGAKKVELLPSPEIGKWFPETGGKGIIEPDYPKNREEFGYQTRTGNTLFGVADIAAPHAKHVAIRTGGLADWYAEPRTVKKYTAGKIAIVRPANSPLGHYGAVVECDTLGKIILFHDSPSKNGSRLHIRFTVRFSKSFLQGLSTDFPICLAGLGKNPSPELTVFAGQASGPAYLGFRNTPLIEIVKRDEIRPTRVLPDTDYCVETSTETVASDRMESTLWINGRLCAVYRSKHETWNKASLFLELGKVGNLLGAGKMWLDDVVVADGPIGLPLRSQSVHLKGTRFALANIRQKNPHSNPVAAQWQISTANNWLLPAYNSGLDTGNVLGLSYPHSLVFPVPYAQIKFQRPEQPLLQIPQGHAALVRRRILRKNGIWDSWSQPTYFTPLPRPTHLHRQTLRVNDAWFMLPGGTKRIYTLERGKWHDIHVRFTPLDPHSFLDVRLTGDPESDLGHYSNRGGNFRPQCNYLISFAFSEQAVYARQHEGWSTGTALIGKKGLYCDDRKGVSLLDDKGGKARARIRLLEPAVLGTWKLVAFLAENKEGVSPVFQKLFTLTDRAQSEDKPERSRAGVLLLSGLVVVCFIIIAVWVRSRKASGTKEIPLANAGIRNDRVQAANQYIIDNFTRPISLNDVATAIAVSPNWLGKLFKKETGKNVVTYINELRVNKAKELLRDTNLKVNQIGLQAGFNTPANFNDMFRRMAGMPPIAFREKTDKQQRKT